MNYTSIIINGQKVGIKFGMASFRYLSEKFVDGKAYHNNELTEIGISYIVYSGYYNNCIVKEEEPNLSFSDFVDWVETSLTDSEKSKEVMDVISLWASNDFVKKKEVEKEEENTEEPKKKISRGKK
jgi:hypothetical protein